MKYPEKQYNVLVEALKQLAVHLDIKAYNPVALYYVVYQQFSESQKHNHLYCCVGGELKKYHKLTEGEKTEAVKFLNTKDKTLELYPEGCNDSHIETAVKRAVKELTQ
jgi:hypothetical protein